MSIKHLACIAGACAPLLAAAQSSVTLYGIADAGVRHTRGLTAAQAPGPSSTSALGSGIANTSRLGFRGTEDLGGGARALFNLETGLNLDTGAPVNAAKTFDRASFVGLGNAGGTLTAGRQTNLLVDAIGPVDALGMRFASFNPNIVTTALSAHGLGIEYGSSGAATGSYRLDNAVKYSGNFGPVVARAMYSFGEAAAAASARSSAGLGAQYQQEKLVVTGAYQRFKSASFQELEAATLGASYQFATVRLAANYGRNQGFSSATDSTVQKVASVGATWAGSAALDVTAALYRLDRSRTRAIDDGYTRAILFAEYKLSRRTRLYAEADYTRWKNDYQGAGNRSRATGLTAGVMHAF